MPGLGCTCGGFLGVLSVCSWKLQSLEGVAVGTCLVLHDCGCWLCLCTSAQHAYLAMCVDSQLAGSCAQAPAVSMLPSVRVCGLGHNGSWFGCWTQCCVCYAACQVGVDYVRVCVGYGPIYAHHRLHALASHQGLDVYACAVEGCACWLNCGLDVGV